MNSCSPAFLFLQPFLGGTFDYVIILSFSRSPLSHVVFTSKSLIYKTRLAIQRENAHICIKEAESCHVISYLFFRCSKKYPVYVLVFFLYSCSFCDLWQIQSKHAFLQFHWHRNGSFLWYFSIPLIKFLSLCGQYNKAQYKQSEHFVKLRG